MTKQEVNYLVDLGNTGDGEIGMITVEPTVKQGHYNVIIIEPEIDGDDYMVKDPEGKLVGTGLIDITFSGGGISFTLSEGASYFVPGDQLFIIVDKY